MAFATLPDLSTTERVRYDSAVYLSALAASIAATLLLGPGLDAALAWGAAAIAILLIAQAALRRPVRRPGQRLITHEDWNRARLAAHRSWALSVTGGFVWGFVVFGGVEHSNWDGRIAMGMTFAVLAVLIAMPWKRSKPRPG